MDGVERLSERLDRFLSARGSSRGHVLASLDEPFGRPLLVVAAGSVLQGVGNARSDLDIISIVEAKVSRMPLASYTRSVLVDPAYFSVAEAEAWITALRDTQWPPAGGVSLDRWGARLEQLIAATRLAYGVALFARDGWAEWMTAFREPWLRAQVCAWWRLEATRRRLAARWLRDAKPMLAAQRQLEAVLALLELRAAEAGSFFFGPKWLAEKLRTLGEAHGLALFREVMHAPARAAEVPEFMARCNTVLDDLGAKTRSGDLVAFLSLLPGVEVERRNGSVSASRGKLRGVVLEGGLPACSGTGGSIWQGPLTADLPADILRLFLADLTWLSVGLGTK